MKKPLLIIICLISSTLLLTSCGEKNIKAPITSNKEQDQLVENNNEPNEQTKDKSQESQGEPDSAGVTKEDAVQKVRDYLNLNDDLNVIIEYDHERDGKYVIHVYDVVDQDSEREHTATRGWYIVDPATGSIESMF